MMGSPSLILKGPGVRLLSHRSAILRHSSRGVLQSNFDRYSTIRLFFKQQQTAPPVNTKTSSRDVRFHALEDAGFPHRCRIFVRLNHSDVKHESQHGRSSSEHSSSEIEPPPPPPPLNWENHSRLYRRLAESLSHLHRPTKDDFLKVADGFWQRLHIRFKWFTIRSFRRFNADDISAFITWFLMSQTLWIFIGTYVRQCLVPIH